MVYRNITLHNLDEFESLKLAKTKIFGSKNWFSENFDNLKKAD